MRAPPVVCVGGDSYSRAVVRGPLFRGDDNLNLLRGVGSRS